MQLGYIFDGFHCTGCRNRDRWRGLLSFIPEDIQGNEPNLSQMFVSPFATAGFLEEEVRHATHES